MIADELKAQCLAKAEEIARPHSADSDSAFTCNGVMGYMGCTCGRDAEVLRIAKELQAMYEAGRIVGYSEGGTAQYIEDRHV